MNIRSLTRGDGVVIGAAVVLFIASFLGLSSVDCPSGIDCSKYDMPNAWDALGLLMSMFLAGVIGAALIVLARAMPGRKVAGLDLGQFGVALTVFALWTAFWTILDTHSAGAGMILGLLAAIVLAAGAVASPLVPALKAPLMGAPRPQAPQPYGGAQPGAAGPGYGYPGVQQGGTGGYGYPAGGHQQPGRPVGADHGQPQPEQQVTPAAAQQGAPAGDFAPFWFAVPVARPLYAEDGSPAPIAELAPGTWYLAVEQRGAALVAQTQDGRRGVLQDTTGIQRG
ncbi:MULTISPECIES: DUF5336 domain-containing protein [Streptomyces]|uniref:DUF5336 domain-containing protein n=1 Tax=Streptomyces sudanensis TaxID=436397 RepID=A0ABY4TFY6_9ACTN|nr:MULTISPECIES: DUF5336 domain-containing protein [Streptomyces]MCP9959174.1 DUF5336 domain-containing protein [Streptomyces sudanensis]MCP9988256.1 DUF5336 domain-containing protein [Streptomyces sudanensis]MCQ0000366.1 DUF5336 domain-containing protein [Streptomyces sudanensis]URN15925.1 DUF5336 domain-containing protein [Streptomyces sudanensis]